MINTGYSNENDGNGLVFVGCAKANMLITGLQLDALPEISFQ